MSFSKAGCSSSQTLVGIGKLQGEGHRNPIGSGGKNHRWIKTVGLRLRMFRGSKGFHHMVTGTHPRKETNLEGPSFVSLPCTGALCVLLSPRTHCAQRELLPCLFQHSIFLPRLAFSLLLGSLVLTTPFLSPQEAHLVLPQIFVFLARIFLVSLCPTDLTQYLCWRWRTMTLICSLPLLFFPSSFAGTLTIFPYHPYKWGEGRGWGRPVQELVKWL